MESLVLNESTIMDFERERHRDSALFMLQSCKTLQSSPSLTTLDFDMSVGVYDDPNDLDMRSTISSATSKLLGKELVPRVMESLVTIGDVLDTDEKEALFQFDVIGDSSQTRRGD